jgi:hypothetical protein
MAGEMLMTAVPELLDDYAARAAGVSGALAHEADRLAAAIDRFTATCDRSLLRGPLPDPARYRALATRIGELGTEAARTAAAVRTADTTAGVDIVSMPQAAFARARAGRAQPVAPTAPPSIDEWRRRAYGNAGIDSTRWDPRADMHTNDATIRAVWERYGQLYLADPGRFWWAGIAKLGGATVYAGMMDLTSIADVTDREARVRALREWVQRAAPGLADDVVGWLLARIVEVSGEQLDSFIALFQRMQRAIADDLLWQHEAFLAGGLAALAPYVHRGLSAEVYAAWVDIASGDRARVARGNLQLLEQEQREVLPDLYGELSGSPAGMALVEVLTLMTESPVPGGKPYRDVMVSEMRLGPIPLPDPDVPLHRQLLPGPPAHVRGSIADTDDRWEWITADMWPAYERFVRAQPDQLDELMRTPVAELAEPRRESPLPYGR